MQRCGQAGKNKIAVGINFHAIFGIRLNLHRRRWAGIGKVGEKTARDRVRFRRRQNRRIIKGVFDERGRRWQRRELRGKTIFRRDRLADEIERSRFQIAATRRDGDESGHIRRAHGDAIDAALDIEKLFVDGIRFAAVVAAAPDAGAGDVKIHARLHRRAALAIRVHHFHVNQCNVRAIGLQPARPKNRRELQRHRRPNRVFRLSRSHFALLVSDGFYFAWLPRDVFKSEKIAVGNFSMAERFSVHKQFHVAAVRRDINCLLGAGGIIPVADDVDLRVVTKHRLANVISLLRQAHAVHFTARARHFRRIATAAGGVGKNPVRAAAMVGRADFENVLRDFIRRIFFRGQDVIRFSLRFGIAKIRR